MEFNHVPVLFDEVIESLNIKKDGVYIDGTVGGGGHASGICSKLSENGTLIALDRDEAALEASEIRLKGYKCRKKFIHANYSDISILTSSVDVKVSGVILDLGVSSFQLDTPERGFSYMNDAPLDMRMDARQSLTAYEVVNKYSEEELFRIIKEYGEEKWALRISQFILKARSEKEIASTGELVEIIKNAIPASARRTGPHPAKRTFQAIRIEVNQELEHLEKCIDSLIDLLEPHGRISIITFHSLEDRIVKNKFDKRLNPCTCPKEFPVCMCGKKADVKKVYKKAIIPSEKELETNSRARSAKLRVLEKI